MSTTNNNTEPTAAPTAQTPGAAAAVSQTPDDDLDNMTEAQRSMREEELSFYSNSTNEHGDDNIWGLLSGVGGNIYEWYVRCLVRAFVNGWMWLPWSTGLTINLLE